MRRVCYVDIALPHFLMLNTVPYCEPPFVITRITDANNATIFAKAYALLIILNTLLNSSYKDINLTR